MKLTDVTALGLRIFGLYLFINCMKGIGYFLAVFTEPGAAASLDMGKPTLYASYFIPLGFSLFLLIFPSPIARLITPASSEDSPLLEENGHAIQVAAFTAIGVFMLASAIPDFVTNALSYWVRTVYMEADYNKLELYQIVVYEIATVIEIAIGIYLVFGAKGIARLIESFRSWGLPKSES